MANDVYCVVCKEKVEKALKIADRPVKDLLLAIWAQLRLIGNRMKHRKLSRDPEYQAYRARELADLKRRFPTCII